ncbi:MAG: NAD(P)H-dependent oxidoreductase [Candidatus Bipolaricaulaceae bacterium]
MSVLVVAGSPRARANSRAIAAFLRGQLERRGQSVVQLDVRDALRDMEGLLARSAAELAGAEAVVLVLPVYLDLPPAPALEWLYGVWERRDQLEARAIALYVVSHSGYFEPVHKQVSLEACQHLSRRLGWAWHGGLAIGGTSPIAGEALERKGLLTRRLRRVLGQLAEVIADGRAVPAGLARRAAKAPLPVPIPLLIWLMNGQVRRRLRRAAGPG